MRRVLHVLAGAVFGFLLSRARATDYDAIAEMFLFRDLHLMGVMGAAIGTGALGFLFLRGRAPFRAAPDFRPKTLTPGVVAGSLIFGAGWALSGT
jgi:uncharacterized protein